MIKAISKLHDPHIKYAIAGIGPEKNNLEKLVTSLHLGSQVFFLGYLENLDGLYFAADLNMFISTREGLGLGGLDGVSHGLYIIGSKNTGMHDYIINSSIGLLVDSPKNVNQVSNAICVAKNSHSGRIEDISIVDKFSQNRVDRLMIKIYQSVFFAS